MDLKAAWHELERQGKSQTWTPLHRSTSTSPAQGAGFHTVFQWCLKENMHRHVKRYQNPTSGAHPAGRLSSRPDRWSPSIWGHPPLVWPNADYAEATVSQSSGSRDVPLLGLKQSSPATKHAAKIGVGQLQLCGRPRHSAGFSYLPDSPQDTVFGQSNSGPSLKEQDPGAADRLFRATFLSSRRCCSRKACLRTAATAHPVLFHTVLSIQEFLLRDIPLSLGKRGSVTTGATAVGLPPLLPCCWPYIVSALHGNFLCFASAYPMQTVRKAAQPAAEVTSKQAITKQEHITDLTWRRRRGRCLWSRHRHLFGQSLLNKYEKITNKRIYNLSRLEL